MLDGMDVESMPPVTLISILTATAPIKDKLLGRSNFYTRTKKAIEAVRGVELTEKLLVGLE